MAAGHRGESINYSVRYSHVKSSFECDYSNGIPIASPATDQLDQSTCATNRSGQHGHLRNEQRRAAETSRQHPAKLNRSVAYVKAKSATSDAHYAKKNTRGCCENQTAQL